MYKRNLWDRLLDPINPHLSILIGLLNIVFGMWTILVPPPDTAVIYPYLQYFQPGEPWGFVILIVGIWMLYVHFFHRVRYLFLPMSVNGVMWSIMTALVAFGDWHASVWILMSFVAIYSLFVAANLKVNFGLSRHSRGNRVREKLKFVLRTNK